MTDAIKPLMPPNATELERGLEKVTAQSVARTEFDYRKLWNPDTCPEALLPWLAWSLSVDDWSPDWAIDKKRTVIREAIDIHRKKGTKGAIKRQLQAVNRPVHIVEWFEDQAEWKAPYSFQVRVDLEDEGIDDRHYAEIQRAVDMNKNARSYYRMGVWLTNRSKTPRIGAATLAGEMTTIYPWNVTELINQSRNNYGGAQYAADTTSIYPLGTY